MDERRRVSQQQERRLAKKSGADLHAGSGSGARRNDMHTDDELIECKTTLRGKKQITLKANDLRQVFHEAVVQGRVPLVHLELGGKGYFVIPEEDYAELAWGMGVDDDEAGTAG